MKRLIIILTAVSLILYLSFKSYATDKVTQETKGDQSPAIYVSPGGKSNIYYEINSRFTSYEFEQELEHVPSDVRGKVKDLFYAGVRAAEEGRYPDAIIHFNNSIEDYPTVSAYIKLSYCYMHLTMYAKAEEVFFHGLDLAVQRDLKPFEDVLNDGFLKRLVFYYEPVVQEIEQEKGNFVLFGFFEAEDQWYIVFSASWPDWDKDKVLDYFFKKLVKRPEIVSFPLWKAVIQPMDPSEKLIKDILKALEDTEDAGGRVIRHGKAWSNLGPLKRGYVIIPKRAVMVMEQPSAYSSPP